MRANELMTDPTQWEARARLRTRGRDRSRLRAGVGEARPRAARAREMGRAGRHRAAAGGRSGVPPRVRARSGPVDRARSGSVRGRGARARAGSDGAAAAPCRGASGGHRCAGGPRHDLPLCRTARAVAGSARARSARSTRASRRAWRGRIFCSATTRTRSAPMPALRRSAGFSRSSIRGDADLDALRAMESSQGSPGTRLGLGSTGPSPKAISIGQRPRWNRCGRRASPIRKDGTPSRFSSSAAAPATRRSTC